MLGRGGLHGAVLSLSCTEKRGDHQPGRGSLVCSQGCSQWPQRRLSTVRIGVGWSWPVLSLSPREEATASVNVG